jgi:hypothetical protein
MVKTSKKYPKTLHHPLSLTVCHDDKRHDDDSFLIGKQIAITEKRDGENTTLTKETFHARSLDSSSHPSRSMVKQLHSVIRHDMPDGMRICGENLYAHHSIGYDNLTSYFEVFNIWKDDVCLSLTETLEWCELFDLVHVPILYVGLYDVNKVSDVFKSQDHETCEGIVIRNVESFDYADFSDNVCKLVRANHVQTDEHWMHKQLTINKLVRKEKI